MNGASNAKAIGCGRSPMLETGARRHRTRCLRSVEVKRCRRNAAKEGMARGTLQFLAIRRRIGLCCSARTARLASAFPDASNSNASGLSRSSFSARWAVLVDTLALSAMVRASLGEGILDGGTSREVPPSKCCPFHGLLTLCCTAVFSILD